MAARAKQREFEFTWNDFEALRKISYKHTGIVVSDEKYDMFYSRLVKRIRTLGLKNFREYCKLLEEGQGDEFDQFINSITTNLTSFFREIHHFEFLAETVLPQILRMNIAKRRVRIWSAGCSSGEEPYSLAMTVAEHIPRDWDTKILATDLDTNVLAAAAAGVYPSDRMDGISASRSKRWLLNGKGPNQGKMRVSPDLQSMIRFKQLNLMGEWPMQGPFDFIFCRNVLIYFDKETKIKLISRYADILVEGGHLFIGHSESLYQITDRFKLIGNTIYRKT